MIQIKKSSQIIINKIIKKHSSRKCAKGKTGFRTPSVFRVAADKKNRSCKMKNKTKK